MRDLFRMRDVAWLVDMLIACQKVERFVHGVDGAAFLGEAAKQISAGFRAKHTEIPCRRDVDPPDLT
jgi:uncharacterized protein with HEPN domain